jgi:hypothetical protein
MPELAGSYYLVVEDSQDAGICAIRYLDTASQGRAELYFERACDRAGAEKVELVA